MKLNSVIGSLPSKSVPVQVGSARFTLEFWPGRIPASHKKARMALLTLVARIQGLDSAETEEEIAEYQSLMEDLNLASQRLDIARRLTIERAVKCWGLEDDEGNPIPVSAEQFDEFPEGIQEPILAVLEGAACGAELPNEPSDSDRS